LVARLALNSLTIDGERLAHQLQLEAARRALDLVTPDATGLEQAPIRDLQWALSDLELGHVRPSLKQPSHRKRHGNKPDNMETLTFKARCLKAALLLRAAGDSKLKADATVINKVADAAKHLRLQMTRVPVGTYGEPLIHDGKPRGTTLDGWRRAHRDRIQKAQKAAKSGEGTGILHVSLEAELGVPPEWPTDGGIGFDHQAVEAKFRGKGKEPTRYPVKDSWGLVLAVARNNQKTWEYWFRGDDTERWAWRELGTYPDMLLARARKEHQKLCKNLATRLLAFLNAKYGGTQS
jgi:hypothetical protein